MLLILQRNSAFEIYICPFHISKKHVSVIISPLVDKVGNISLVKYNALKTSIWEKRIISEKRSFGSNLIAPRFNAYNHILFVSWKRDEVKIWKNLHVRYIVYAGFNFLCKVSGKTREVMYQETCSGQFSKELHITKGGGVISAQLKIYLRINGDNR